MKRNSMSLGVLFLAVLATTTQAGWLDQLKEKVLDSGAASQTATALTNDEMIGGLRAALEKGVAIAVAQLGQTDGFFGNPQVRIPLPDHLQTVSKGLRLVGQEKYADEFELTMNRAAEAAVPEAKAIFMDAIHNMSIEDAKGILNGGDDAATRYFRKVGEERLFDRMLPVVKETTTRTGVTNSYNALVKQLDFLGTVVDTESLNLDNYVTEKGLDGLFLLIAQEEKRIRENPVARTTDLLKKVFGAAGG